MTNHRERTHGRVDARPLSLPFFREAKYPTVFEGTGRMLAGLMGRLLRALAPFGSPDTRDDLVRVGDELVRLDRRPRQPRPISR